MSAPSPKEARRIWIDELRSGKYTQGIGSLHLHGSIDHLCCLGLACRIAVDHGWLNLAVQKNPGSSVVTYDGQSADLHVSVQRLYGLRDPAGEYDRGALADHNDSGATFAEIADIIEAEPEGLIAKVGAA